VPDSYSYAATGNLVSSSALGNFGYDARHRLIQNTVGASTVNYQVNALGQRVKKSPASGSATVYHYDKDGKLIAESDASGVIKTSYVYLNDLPVAVVAQSTSSGVCDVSAPQVDSGTTFVPFDNLSRLEVRSGRPNNADWQWALGVNTHKQGRFTEAYLNWVSGRAYHFTLKYDGQGGGNYTVSHAGSELFSRTWNTGLRVGNALQFFAKTTAGIGAGNFITVNLKSIDGAPINASLRTAGDDLTDRAVLTYLIPTKPKGGLTVRGTISFTFSGRSPPAGSRMDLRITAGNVNCSSAQEALYFISLDQLNTPRVVSDKLGKVVWQWDGEPFGSSRPNEDPDGDGQKFTLNLRFPGQYFDVETGLHYNYFRDYDPATGRYVESDPIGLTVGLTLICM
jgi:RHS repeat-associated protein